MYKIKKNVVCTIFVSVSTHTDKHLLLWPQISQLDKSLIITLNTVTSLTEREVSLN